MKLVWWMIVVAVSFGLVLWWFLRPSRREKLRREERLPLEDDEPPR